MSSLTFGQPSNLLGGPAAAPFPLSQESDINLQAAFDLTSLLLGTDSDETHSPDDLNEESEWRGDGFGEAAALEGTSLLCAWMSVSERDGCTIDSTFVPTGLLNVSNGNTAGKGAIFVPRICSTLRGHRTS